MNKGFEHRGRASYEVLNQNGFTNALYHAVGCWEDETGDWTKKELRRALQGYPLSYPCLVEFQDLMLECPRIHVKVTSSDEYNLLKE